MTRIITFLLVCISIIAHAQEAQETGFSKQDRTYLDSLWYSGELEKAVQYVEELIQNDSLNPEFYCYLGFLIEAENPADKTTISHLKKAISLDPRHVDAYWFSGKYYMKQVYGQDYDYKISYLENDSTIYIFNEYYLDSAIFYYEKLLDIDSAWLYSVRSSLFDLYLSNGERFKADLIKTSEYQPPLKTDSLNIPAGPGMYYFPIELLIDTINTYYGHTVRDNGFVTRRTDQAHFNEWWYSNKLYKSREPVLYNGWFEHEIYRFTWLRSFDEPVVIRIENKEDSIRLFVKMLDYDDFYVSNEIILNDTIVLNASQWTEFTEKLKKIDFWSIDPIENTHGAIGTDGAQWILEGLKDGEYHMVDRWNGKNKVTGEGCLYLIQISGLEIENIY